MIFSDEWCAHIALKFKNSGWKKLNSKFSDVEITHPPSQLEVYTSLDGLTRFRSIAFYFCCLRAMKTFSSSFLFFEGNKNYLFVFVFLSQSLDSTDFESFRYSETWTLNVSNILQQFDINNQIEENKIFIFTILSVRQSNQEGREMLLRKFDIK